MDCSNDDSGGISSSGKFLKSDYFSRLEKLGDFASATKVSYDDLSVGYHYPYLDFGISGIYGNYYYVIGMKSNSKLKPFIMSELQSYGRNYCRNELKFNLITVYLLK